MLFIATGLSATLQYVSLAPVDPEARYRSLAEPVVGHRRRAGLRAPVDVLRVKELERDANFRELAVVSVGII